MTPTNRPITSREYKLMLNTERFRDRQAGAGLFWKLLTFLVENQGNEVIPDAGDPDKDAERARTTWYLDTPGYKLRRVDVNLRVREEPDAKKPYRLFCDVQNQAGWLAQFGTTKTAYVFEVL